MKETYIKPSMIIENFMPNQAVSTCTVTGGIDYKFDCMKGPNIDTAKVLAAGIAGVSGNCDNNAGYAPLANVAVDKSSRGRHSNNNSSIATWDRDLGYNRVTYSGKVDGLLYADAGGKNNGHGGGGSTVSIADWSVVNGVVTHSENSGLTHHMVAPVVDSYSIQASW